MRHLILSLLLLGGNMVLAQNLVIEKQGHFSVSGSVILHKGAYDNSKFVACINKHGGKATLVELPKIGIHGNTHFLMQDLNNKQLAELLNNWLVENGL